MQHWMNRFRRMNGAAADSILLTFIRAVTTVVGLVIAKLLSISFSLGEYGTYSQISLLVTTADSLTILGMTDAVNYFYNSSSAPKEKQKYLGTIFDVQYLLGATWAVLLLLFQDGVIAYFKNEQLRGILWVAAFWPLFQNLFPMMQVLFIASGRSKFIAARNFVISILRLLVVLSACFITRNIKTIILLLACLDLVQVVVFKFILTRNHVFIRVRNFDKTKLREIFAFCVPMAVYLMTSSFSVDLDKYVVSYFADTETLAIYTTASKVLPFDLVTMSFITVLIPIITRQVRGGRYSDALQSFRAYLRLGYIVTWGLAFGAVVLAPDVMCFLYDEKYLPGLSVFVIYLFVDMFKFANTSLILVAKGKTQLLMIISLSALTANLVFNIPAYLTWGIIGPAITTIVITFVLVVVQLAISAHQLQSNLWALFHWWEMLLVVLELLLTGVGVLFFRWLVGEYVTSTTLRLILCYGLYLAILLTLNGRRILNCLKDINRLK